MGVLQKNGILFCLQDAEEKLQQNLVETRSLLEERNEEIELKVKELMELRESIKTAEQDKFQELDKVGFICFTSRFCRVTATIALRDSKLLFTTVSVNSGGCLPNIHHY